MSNEPQILPYEPFPAFSDFVASAGPFDAYDGFAAAFAAARKEIDGKDLEFAVTVATKWAAVDTGAIEGLYDVERGFTFSVAISGAAWDSIHQIKGDDVARSIEDQMRGYEHVLDIATNSRPITEAWIRELHATICASQDTYTVLTALGPQSRELTKGQYKTDPNSPLNFQSNEIHGYASPLDTPPEMERLLRELQSDAFRDAHPVVQAAYAHYAFVCVHPFPDGNGRVSRALSSVYLYREPGIPLVIFADQKPPYIASLEAADAGDYRPFARFIAERAIDTIGMVRTVLETSKRPAIKDQIAAAQAMLIGRGGLSHQELDATGSRLVEMLEAALTKVIANSELRPPLSASVNRTGGITGPQHQGYRDIPNNPIGIRLQIASAPPLGASAQRAYSIQIARPDHDGPDFRISSRNGLLLEAELREIHPSVSPPLQFRVETAAEGEIGDLLNVVVTKGQEALRSQGYAL